MPDLPQRAEDQRAFFDQLVVTVRGDLTAARAERDRRHPDPGAIDPGQWRTDLGATQHLEAARVALAANRVGQASVRGQLAGVATPAQAGAEGAALADLLVAEGVLEVGERAGRERVLHADSLVADLALVLNRAEATAADAAARTAWAEDHQALHDSLRAALAEPPLSTLVLDAAEALAGAELADAEARMAALLPEPLRLRAEARLAEAVAELAAARRHRATVGAAMADRALEARPLEAALQAAFARLEGAEAALDAYVSRGSGRLAAARSALAGVAAQPDLTAAQSAALFGGAPADGADLLAREAELVGASAAVQAATRDLDDAELALVDGDPDADPATTGDPEVEATNAALEGALGALGTSRDAHPAGERAALDAWEVEVPTSVWSALAGLATARSDLEVLSDASARDALVAELDTAADEVVTGLDDRDVRVRRELQHLRERAQRVATESAAAATADARLRAYTRGHGVSGRFPAQL